MSKYFVNATNANAAGNVYQINQQNVVSSAASTGSAATSSTSSAIRKLFTENTAGTRSATILPNTRGVNSRTTKVFMTTTNSQQQSNAPMATHLLDHGYGVSLTPPVVTTNVVVGQQTASTAAANSTPTTGTNAANIVTSNTTPASQQQQQQQQKFKPTDMTQYYKVS